MPRTVSVADSVPRRPTRSRSPSFAFDDGSPVMHQSMRWPRSRKTSATRRTPSIASPSSSEVSSSATVPRMVADARRRNAPARPTNAATLPFMSAAPRPYSTPSRIVGHERIAGPGLARARRHHVGVAEQHQHRPAAAVRRPQVVDVAEAQRARMRSRRAAGAAAISAWQPASSGVTERARDQLAGRASSTSLISAQLRNAA